MNKAEYEASPKAIEDQTYIVNKRVDLKRELADLAFDIARIEPKCFLPTQESTLYYLVVRMRGMLTSFENELPSKEEYWSQQST